MSAHRQLERIQRLLSDTLAPKLSGVTVEVLPPGRWNRPVAIIRWAGFSGLLAEQRFRAVVSKIPTEVFERELTGLIWFELAPGEEVNDYLRMPRSDDVAAKAESLFTEALKAGLADKLEFSLGATPTETCGGSFNATRKVLAAQKWAGSRIDDFCLAAIGRGAYCDCELLGMIRPA